MAAQARIGQARAAFQPRVHAAAGYQRLSAIEPFVLRVPRPGGESAIVIAPNIPNRYQLEASVEQPLFQGGRLRAQLEAARQEAAVAQAAERAEQEALAYRIATAYWRYVEAQALATAAEENVRRLEAHAQDARNRRAQGLLLDSDVFDAEVALAQAQFDALQRRQAAERAAVTLNALVGLPPDATPVPTDRPDTAARAVPSLDTLRAWALRRRPDLAGLRYAIARAAALQAAARAGHWPQVALVGRYVYARPNPRLFPLQDRFQSAWDVGLSLSFELWNGQRTRHQVAEQVAEAAALRRQAEAQEAEARRELDVALTQARLDVERAYEQLALARRVVRQAEARYGVVHEEFTRGLRTVRDLLDAEAARTQAHAVEIQAGTACALAWLALHQATGTLLDSQP